MADLHDDRSETVRSLLALSDQAYRLAYHVAGSADLAQDAVQDAYLDAIEHLPRGLPPEEARAYFLRTAANAARKCLRGESRRRRREAAVAQEAKRSEAPQPAAADRELSGALRAALAGLDEQLRLPVALCCQEDLPQREAALVLELPETTLSGRLRQGLESLRRTLEKAGYPAAAGAALIEGLRQATPSVPAGLAAKLQAVLAGATAAGTKAAGGAAAAAAGGALALGWKLLAGASLAALLGLGAFGIGRHLRPAASAAPEPAPAAGDQSPAAPDDAVRRALSAEVTVSRGCMRIYDLLLLLHRQCGLRSCWPDQVQSQSRSVRIPAGRTTAGAVLDRLARRHDLDLETAVHLGQVTAFYWPRPDTDAMLRLEALAASQDEVDRCVAARWLPAAGSRRSLSLALEMLADRSERVRRYALFGLAESAPGGSWEYRADPLRYLAAPGAGRAVADRLREIATDRRAGRPVGTTGSQAVGLARRLGHPDCLPPLLEIVGTELSRERPRFVRGKTPGGSWSWSVCPRDPARLQDGSLMAACCEALRGPAAPEAERQVLDFYSRVSGLDRQHFFPALASLAAPAGEQALFALIADPKESEYLRDRAMGALVGSGRREVVDRLSAMAREKGARADRLVSQFSLRTGSQGILELALARVEAETDAKKRQQLCWDICTATDAGEKVIPVLEKLVEGEDEGIRSGSITALGLTGSERAVPVLIRIMKTGKGYRLDSRAALALGDIASPEAVDALIAALREGNVDVRCGAAQALREAGEKRAVPALRDALKSPFPRLRMQAALGLGALGGVEDIDLLLSAARIPGEAVDERTGQPYERTDPKTGEKSRVPDTCDATGHSVAQLGSIGGERAAAELVSALKAGTAEAARGLLDSRDPACRRALRRLISEGDRGLANALMKADRLRPPAGLLGFDLVPLLVAWGGEHGISESSIGDGSWRHNMGDPRQIEALAQVLLRGTEAGTRIRAAGLLEVRSLRGARLADPVAAEALLRVARQDRDPKVRAAAIGGPLRSFVREDELTRVLLGLLGDPDPQVREAAARALSPGPYLTEHVPEVRKLLAAERQPGAREAISRLLEDWGRHTADKLPEPEPQPQPPPTPRPPEPAEIF